MNVLPQQRLAMVGSTLRRAGQSELTRYLPAASAAEPQVWLHRLARACGFDEVVYLATCNRVEVVFVRPATLDVALCRRRLFAFFNPEAPPLGEVGQRAAVAFHAYDGEGAAEHLFEVAASLDSLNPGEAQILGQVKAAYRSSRTAGLLGPHLQLAFEEAFEVAKKVRHETRLGGGTVSMVSLAKAVIDRCLLALPPAPRTLAVIGVGDMARQCGLLFGGRDGIALLFVNRTRSRAQALAAQYGGTALGLEAFLAAPPPVHVIVSATAAPQPFLDAEFFARLTRQPQAVTVIDLAVQRDACPQAAAAHGVTLYDLDRLSDLSAQAQQERLQQVAAARQRIAAALLAYRRRVAERDVAPVVRALRAQLQRRMDHEVEGLLRTLALHEAPQRQAVQRWAQAVVGRLAHAPTVGLKRLAFAHGSAAVATLVEALVEGRPLPDKGAAVPGDPPPAAP